MESDVHAVMVSNEEQSAPDAALTQLRAQHRFIVNLLQIAAALASAETPSGLAQQAVRMVVDRLPGIEGAALWLWMAGEERLRIAAMHSVPDLLIFDPELIQSFAPRLHEGYVGEAVASGQPLVLPDATAFLHSLQMLNGTNVAALRDRLVRIPPSLRTICLPLRIDTHPVGALDVYTTSLEPELVLADLPLLQLFADQLAGMIATVRHCADLEGRYRWLQAFDEVVTAIRDISDLSQLLERALVAILNATGAQYGLIALVENGIAKVEVIHGLPVDFVAPGTHWKVEETILATVAQTGQPEVQVLTPEHPWSALCALGVDAIALLPLSSGGTFVGVLVIGGDHELPGHLEWSSLLSIGSQIGIAVEHYQVYTAGQRERRQLATLIASLVEGVLLCDSAGKLLLFNQAATSLLKCPLSAGISLAELTQNLNMRTLGGPPVSTEAMPLARALRGEVVRDDEVMVTGAAGEDIIISCSAVPLPAEDGAIDGAVMVCRDITAHKQYDAVRDEFLAVAAHELRAPLASIKGYSDLLVKREIQRPDATERDRKGSVMLSRQIDHLVQLVDNLLDVSRIDTGRLDLYLQSVDLVVLLEACIERIRVGEPNHQFVFDGPPMLEVVCDQLRIQQVFTNLLANAARYSPPGTEIRVEVWMEDSSLKAEATLGHSNVDTWVVVAVHDQGVGIPAELQEQVFERYYRANTVHAASGLGLGLYLSREIVMRHGGRIWLESEPGHGTTFYVALLLNQERTMAVTKDTR
jgi:two-component system phosphate regulon sensor histidine kinase PhoR